jgi:hypothetical protein
VCCDYLNRTPRTSSSCPSLQSPLDRTQSYFYYFCLVHCTSQTSASVSPDKRSPGHTLLGDLFPDESNIPPENGENQNGGAAPPVPLFQPRGGFMPPAGGPPPSGPPPAGPQRPPPPPLTSGSGRGAPLALNWSTRPKFGSNRPPANPPSGSQPLAPQTGVAGGSSAPQWTLRFHLGMTMTELEDELVRIGIPISIGVRYIFAIGAAALINKIMDALTIGAADHMNKIWQ